MDCYGNRGIPCIASGRNVTFDFFMMTTVTMLMMIMRMMRMRMLNDAFFREKACYEVRGGPLISRGSLFVFSQNRKKRRKKKTEVTRRCNKDGLGLLEVLDLRKVYQNEDHPT